MDTYSRIAIFRALYLGDLLVSVPALRSLRAGFPRAEITLIGLPWAGSFAERMGRYVDRFVPFPGYPGLSDTSPDRRQAERFLAEQRAYRYDLVVQMHGSGGTSNRVALGLGAKVTAGYYEGQRPSDLVVATPYPSDQPEIQRNLGLARLLGCPDMGTHLEFPLNMDDRREASLLLEGIAQNGHPLIGIHPGAKRPAQRWPAERFAAVADALARRHAARIVLTGGPGEEDTVLAVAGHMETEPISLAGKTTLGVLAALIRRLDLFISNDTGPAHIAQAVDTASVIIFGPADISRWAPLDTVRHQALFRPVPCSPCPYRQCPIDHRCLRSIKPEDVIDAADGLLVRGVAA